MDVELLRKIGQRLIALDGGQCHLRLERRCVVPARSSAHHLSCSTAILALVRQKSHLSGCPDSPGHLWTLLPASHYGENRQIPGVADANEQEHTHCKSEHLVI